MKKLSKDEMKNVKGGYVPPAGCYKVYSDQGYQSCWYTTGDPVDLCDRVYGSHCEATSNGTVDCASNNCTMN